MKDALIVILTERNGEFNRIFMERVSNAIAPFDECDAVMIGNLVKTVPNKIIGVIKSVDVEMVELRLPSIGRFMNMKQREGRTRHVSFDAQRLRHAANKTSLAGSGNFRHQDDVARTEHRRKESSELSRLFCRSRFDR